MSPFLPDEQRFGMRPSVSQGLTSSRSFIGSAIRRYAQLAGIGPQTRKQAIRRTNRLIYHSNTNYASVNNANILVPRLLIARGRDQ